LVFEVTLALWLIIKGIKIEQEDKRTLTPA
jgi:hypothetical protein